MSLDALMVDTVTILAPAWTVDRYGDLVPDWDHASATTTKGRVARRDAVEILNGRDATVTRWTLYLPPDAVISAFDRVNIDDVLYEADAPALVARGMTGDHHHLEVALRAVIG